MARIIEAYVGEYASGKSENAVNRSLQLKRLGRKVRLVDFDLVEPFFTLRPLKKFLEKSGVDVIGWETAETFGLGEAAIPLRAEMITACDFAGDVIIDVGYGVDGRNILNLIGGRWRREQDAKLHLYMVINTTRPLTATVPLIRQSIAEFGAVDGLINNTHLGDKTTVALIQKGAEMVTAAAKEVGLPVVATTALRHLAREIGERDCMGNVVWPLDRYLKDAIW